MKKYFLILAISSYLTYLLQIVHSAESDSVYPDVYNITINSTTLDENLENKFYQVMNKERSKKYQDNDHQLRKSTDMKNAAYNYAKTKPEGFGYNDTECEYAQQGISYWMQAEKNQTKYLNLNITKVALLFSGKDKIPAYTCGKYAFLTDEEIKTERTTGLSVFADKAKNHRNSGNVDGFQVWIYHYWTYPDNLKPIRHTQTPPPNPDATTGTTITTTSTPTSTTTDSATTTTTTTTTTAKPTTKSPKPPVTEEPNKEPTDEPDFDTTTAPPTEKPDNIDDDNENTDDDDNNKK